MIRSRKDSTKRHSQGGGGEEYDDDNTDGEYVDSDEVPTDAFPIGSIRKAARMKELPTGTVTKVLRSRRGGPNCKSQDQHTNGDDDAILPGPREGSPNWNSLGGEGGRR